MSITSSPAQPPTTDQILFGLENGAQFPPLEPIFALWNAKRGNREMPERGDIAPRDMKAYLRHVQIFDVVDGGRDFRIRVMGTIFIDAIGYDPTGQLVSELSDPILRERLSIACRRVVETRKPLRVTAPFRATSVVLYDKVETILLPLGTESKTTHVLRQVILVKRK